MKADETNEHVSEQAALYALDALPVEEARALEARLTAGDERYRAEVDAFRAVAAQLAYAARPVAPRPAARARVLDAVAAHEAALIENDGLRFVRAAQLDWQPGPVAGIEMKVLTVDPVRERATVLARMAPGAAYPAHRHGGLEELFLLQGELLVGDVLMRAGDYCSAEADSVHHGVRALRDSVLVTTFSTRDEVIA